MKRTLLLLMSLLSVATLSAKVKLPAILADDMVLQRNAGANIWGWAEAGKKVAVVTSWDGKQYDATADSDGRWLVTVTTPGAGGPYSISVSDGEPVVLGNVLIGEVWVFSGQSNMEMPLRGLPGERTDGSMKAQLEAVNYPNIRLFAVPKTYSAEAQEDCKGEWKRSTPGNAGEFSAIAWFFGVSLADVLDIPIGLINTSWGGTLIEPWISPVKIDQIKDIVSVDQNLVNAYPQQAPGVLFNAMIAPVEKFAAKGFVWYQGESNRHNYQVYDRLMEGLVDSWRKAWVNSSMPFYFVEIAPFVYADPNGIDLPLLKEAQHKSLKLIPYSGIAGMLDAGDYISIHPPYKKEASQRLALNALVNDYNIEGIDCKSPVMSGVEYSADKAVVSFDNVPLGFKHEEELDAFEMAGEDRKFYPAKAKVVRHTNKVEVTCDQVPNPVAVRYGFRNWCVGNLFGVSGLPALPFRTDKWDDAF